jgi:hypothetical protein
MKAFRFLRALPLVSLLLASPVLASQATIVGPVTGPHTMADVMGAINAAFLAIQGCNSGSSAPANGPSAAPVNYQMWCDTTTNPVVVKMYDGASWVTVGKLNTSSHIWTPSYQGTDLGTASTATTGTSAHTLGFLDGANTWSGVQSFNSSDLSLKGSSSGAGFLNAPAAASSYVWTLPAASDTLVGKATTDTLTNKTYDTAGTGNSFSINGLAATANTGTGSVVRATSPTLTTPVLGVASATTINKVTVTAPASGSTLTIPDGVTLTGPASSGTAMTIGNTETVTGVKTFGSTGAVGRFKLAGTTSGSTIVDASATASGTLTMPAATDTLIGKATTDTLTNKTFDTAGTGNSFSINGVAATANTGTGSVVRATSPTLTTPTLTTPTMSAPASTGVADVQGTIKLSSFVTSTQLAANANDYTATDGSNTCSSKISLRISTNASRNITGLSCGQAEGDIRIVHNVGAQNAVLTNQDAGSTAANRFLFGGDMTLAADTSVTLRYDGVASRWRAITSPGAGGGGGGVTSVGIVGAGLTVDSGTCTITGSGTCTVTTPAATKSNMQTGTSTTTAVTPAVANQSDSAAKAWVGFVGATAVVNSSYNVTSVTRASTGMYTVTFTTPFASAFYTCSLSAGPAGGFLSADTGTAAPTASTIALRGTSGAGATIDVNGYVVCYGRQ